MGAQSVGLSPRAKPAALPMDYLLSFARMPRGLPRGGFTLSGGKPVPLLVGMSEKKVMWEEEKQRKKIDIPDIVE